jgi:penicillin-binding protein 1A
VRGASGKTGTTDNHVDAWFVGSAQDLTTGVWIGHDRDTPLGAGETGGQAAAPAWKMFMLQAIN